jgi:hypothetical protein
MYKSFDQNIKDWKIETDNDIKIIKVINNKKVKISNDIKFNILRNDAKNGRKELIV